MASQELEALKAQHGVDESDPTIEKSKKRQRAT